MKNILENQFNNKKVFFEKKFRHIFFGDIEGNVHFFFDPPAIRNFSKKKIFFFFQIFSKKNIFLKKNEKCEKNLRLFFKKIFFFDFFAFQKNQKSQNSLCDDHIRNFRKFFPKPFWKLYRPQNSPEMVANARTRRVLAGA